MSDPVMDAVKKAFPDSRTKAQRGQIQTPMGLASPVYCASCGRFAGYTFASTEFMFYLCDGGCDKYGNGLDLPVVDPETVVAANGGG